MPSTGSTGDTANYSLGISPTSSRVRGLKDGFLLFESSKCLLMNETHHEPVYYIPRKDVNMSLLVRSDFRTFCPFKGNTTHWSLMTEDGLLENIAWSYESPLVEAADITGYIAFYDTMLDQLIVDDQIVSGTNSHISAEKNYSLTEWLSQGNWDNSSSVALTRQLVNRLRIMGFPIMRLNVAIRQLHPLLAGESYLWRKGTDEVETQQMLHENVNSEQYLKSPLKLVTEGLGGIRQKLTKDQTEFDFPIMADLRDQGATDYVAFPLIFSDGNIHNLTLTSDDPFGFTTGHLGQIYEALPLISRMYEVHKLKANTEVLLQTYLGKSAGNQVLGGLTKRGDGGTIQAAILHCDLVNSTGLTESLGQEDYLNLLNSFFDAVATAVYAHQGDILKFIGDAVLAIFPLQDNSRKQACLSAARAIRDTVQNIQASPYHRNLSCTAGLHFGEVMYGNIGSEQRLDFTVIGSAANEVARISDHCKQTGHSVILSKKVALDIGEGTQSLGSFNLKGFTKERELFGFDPKKLTS